MALEARVPVIPVAMIDTEKVQPIGKKLPRIRRIGIRFGPPLDFSRYEGLAGDRFVERSMTDEIMYELMQLSGQEYVDLYAAKVKAQAAAGGKIGLPDAAELTDVDPAGPGADREGELSHSGAPGTPRVSGGRGGRLRWRASGPGCAGRRRARRAGRCRPAAVAGRRPPSAGPARG